VRQRVGERTLNQFVDVAFELTIGGEGRIKGRETAAEAVPPLRDAEARAAAALRALADVPYLHARHYGRSGETDYRTRTD